MSRERVFEMGLKRNRCLINICIVTLTDLKVLGQKGPYIKQPSSLDYAVIINLKVLKSSVRKV